MLEPGGECHDDILNSVQSGFYVTEVMGQGVNMVTGDYSRGASGFLVDDGELTDPVEEVTIAGNLTDMFGNVLAAGSNIDDRGNIHTGPVLISSMTVAGE